MSVSPKEWYRRVGAAGLGSPAHWEIPCYCLAYQEKMDLSASILPNHVPSYSAQCFIIQCLRFRGELRLVADFTDSSVLGRFRHRLLRFASTHGQISSIRQVMVEVILLVVLNSYGISHFFSQILQLLRIGPETGEGHIPPCPVSICSDVLGYLLIPATKAQSSLLC